MCVEGGFDLGGLCAPVREKPARVFDWPLLSQKLCEHRARCVPSTSTPWDSAGGPSWGFSSWEYGPGHLKKEGHSPRTALPGSLAYRLCGFLVLSRLGDSGNGRAVFVSDPGQVRPPETGLFTSLPQSGQPGNMWSFSDAHNRIGVLVHTGDMGSIT